MSHFSLGTVDGINRIPPFETVGGAWSTGGSWTAASNGVLIPAAYDARASYDVGHTNEFQVRWNYKTMSTVTSSVGMEFGIFPSANHPTTLISLYVPSPDIRQVSDSPETNYTNIYDNQSRVAQYSPKPNTSDTYEFSRDVTNVIRLKREGALLHQYTAPFSGAIALVARANTLTSLENIVSRAFYSADWNV